MFTESHPGRAEHAGQVWVLQNTQVRPGWPHPHDQRRREPVAPGLHALLTSSWTEAMRPSSRPQLALLEFPSHRLEPPNTSEGG